MRLLKQCTVVYGAVSYSGAPKPGTSVLFDPASGMLLTFNQGSKCQVVPLDLESCTLLNASSFPIDQRCPADYSWPATPISPQREGFYSIQYSSSTPLCSFRYNSVTGNHTSRAFYPDRTAVCGQLYSLQYDEPENMLYVLSFPLVGSSLFRINLTIDPGSLVHPELIWAKPPYIESHQFFLNNQPNPVWDPTGLKLIFFLSSNTPYVRTTNNSLVFRGPQLSSFGVSDGFYDDTFLWRKN
jgi:hypothetical protein